MKKYILLGILSTALISASTSMGQEKRYHDDRRYYRYRHADNEESTSSEDKASSTSDKEFDCYRAWKKDLKREKKEYKAKVKEFQARPLAADRKLRKACKKAWKADVIEREHKSGHDHEYERGFWWY
jgi:hypothetical protein